MPRDAKIQVRRDSAANWSSVNPTLAVGEIGYETDTAKIKVGDGSTAWSSLAYFVGNAVPLSRTISTTSPLTGGGDLSANRTLAINAASTSASGVVQLSDSTSTTSSTLAATPTAVKAAYDAAVASVQPTRTISTTAPLTGGGDLSANRTLSLNIGSSLTTSSSNLIVDSTVVPYLGTANTFTGGVQQISALASSVGLVIKGAVSQTSDLQSWTDSSNNVLLRVDAAGQFRVGSTILINQSRDINPRLLYVNGATFATASANILTTASLVGAIIRGAASQTADLQQWQNSAGSVLAKVDSFGTISGRIARLKNGASSITGSQLSVESEGTTITGVVVRAFASQTANLQEWQNSAGTVLASLAPNGNLRTNFVGSVDAGKAYISTGSTGNSINIWTNATTNIGLTVQGVASQTADLQQWQNSAGTVLASVNSAGAIYSTNTITTAADFRVANGVISYGYANVYSAVIGVAGGTPTNQATLIVKKRNGSETGDFIQFQNSAAAVLAKVDASGNAQFTSIDGGSA